MAGTARTVGGLAARPSPAAGLEHGLGQLLEEERHPVRALDDLGHQLVGQRGAARDPSHERRALPRAEAVERQGRHVRLSGPGRLELRDGR